MTLGLSLADAERITMPEYLALVHHRNATSGEDEAPPPFDPGELNALFLRMERSGIVSLN